MPQFSPDTIEFGDKIGWGYWIDGHYREHQQFITIGFASSPPQFIPDYNLLAWAWDDERTIVDWLNAHQSVHNLSRQLTGVQGVDLSIVDFRNPDYFELWIDTHATEHAQLRQALRIVV